MSCTGQPRSSLWALFDVLAMTEQGVWPRAHPKKSKVVDSNRVYLRRESQSTSSPSFASRLAPAASRSTAAVHDRLEAAEPAERPKLLQITREYCAFCCASRR